jgi:hypothetical protein
MKTIEPNCDKCIRKGTHCYRCGPFNEYQFYKEKDAKKRGPIGKRAVNSQKEGMAFQRDVKSRYKQVTGREAKEQPNSGAMWFAQGDVKAEEALMECKERAGTINAKGEKTFSISKEWLDKVAEEACYKPWILPFRFKNDDEIYVVAKYDFFLELVQTIDFLKGEKDNA